MVKRFSKQVRDELHVACTNWLSPPAPGCGVSLMESARSVLCPASVTLECVRSACPARCGFDFKCYCKTKEKRQTPPCAMSLSVFPYFCRSFSHLGVSQKSIKTFIL